ncbi:Uma2 family endonuclease [Actinokineospora sp.]|uniref:Uma2 family endonuclease n=1 Tax=Actinokineospora sp. TaxID=1872133 RepID=UPI003D6A37A0
MPVTPEEQPRMPWHPQPWTLEDILAMPEDHGQRIELIDGSLHVSPAPDSRHQRVQRRVDIGLEADLPEHLEILAGVNVVLSSERLLIPDVAVIKTPDVDTLYYKADDILLVVEVISPSSRSHDKALKRTLYAEAGIRYYLLVDPVPRPATAMLFRLDGADYVEIAVSRAGKLRFGEPFTADIALA